MTIDELLKMAVDQHRKATEIPSTYCLIIGVLLLENKRYNTATFFLKKASSSAFLDIGDKQASRKIAAAANHYYAYSLDAQAVEALEDIEKCYTAALNLDPTNVIYHSRYLCYLITRGRIKQFEQAWKESVGILSCEKDLYKDLFIPVLRLLLHRSRLDTARDIFIQITHRRFVESEELQVLFCFLLILLDAREGGSCPNDVYKMIYERLPPIGLNPARYLRYL